jgi:hypothetical protein
MGDKWPLDFAYQYIYHISNDLQHTVKYYHIGPIAFLPVRRMSGYRFLLLLKSIVTGLV